MSRPIALLAALLPLSSLAAPALAKDAKVVITVEKPEPGVDAAKLPFQGHRAAVDVAILLDTSNSMDGLIDQAKSQLWTIVQQFAKARKAGRTPLLRVALFEYGNTRLPASEGYIRQVQPLTDDLDKLSEALFALKTSGGDEYCGQVINEAITRLDWSTEPGGYKAIFIAGNEPFTQGSVDYRHACRRAIERGVVVNTVHCGANRAGVDGKWRHGAQLAEGRFFNIDQDRTVIHVDCPQDEVIIKLNAELNKTYLWFGDREVREGYRRNQLAQDENASAYGGGAISGRGFFKATPLYRNVNRDLVDTLREDADALATLPATQLPVEMQSLSVEQRKAYVDRFAAKRAKLQQQIQELTAERERFLAEERARIGASNDGTLGVAVSAAIREQLAEAGFQQDSAQE